MPFFFASSIVTNGTFIGLAATTYSDVKILLNANLYPRYTQDCSDPATQVNFFVVFGVLFSGLLLLIWAVRKYLLVKRPLV